MAGGARRVSARAATNASLRAGHEGDRRSSSGERDPAIAVRRSRAWRCSPQLPPRRASATTWRLFLDQALAGRTAAAWRRRATRRARCHRARGCRRSLARRCTASTTARDGLSSRRASSIGSTPRDWQLGLARGAASSERRRCGVRSRIASLLATDGPMTVISRSKSQEARAFIARAECSALEGTRRCAGASAGHTCYRSERRWRSLPRHGVRPTVVHPAGARARVRQRPVPLRAAAAARSRLRPGRFRRQDYFRSRRRAAAAISAGVAEAAAIVVERAELTMRRRLLVMYGALSSVTRSSLARSCRRAASASSR